MSGLIELLKATLTLFAKSVNFFLAVIPKKKATTTQTTNKLQVQYKDPARQLKELTKLKETNPGLLDVLEFIRAYSEYAFKKEIMLTMVLRTQAEQDELYKNSEKYKAKKFKSPHQLGHAFDLRSKTFKQSEIDEIVAEVNLHFNSTNTYGVTAMYHDVGSGLHFHIQYFKKA